MSKMIKWGILGCGKIADKFARELSYVSNCQLTAVGSRSQKKAKAFAVRHNAQHAYGSYLQAVDDPQVDIFYVASTHNFHYDHVKLCLEHDKAVLCEKPLTLNAAQASELVALAKEKGLFLMEGMWTRFLPSMVKLRELLNDEVIGPPLSFTGSLGFKFSAGPKHRIFNLALGGGALLDLGVYPIALASMIFAKQPQAIKPWVHIGPTGADIDQKLFFTYDQGQTATLSVSAKSERGNEGIIEGANGSIKIVSPLHHSKKLVITLNGSQSTIVDCDYNGHGFRYQIQHVCDCLLSGQTQSEVMPLTESIAIMQTMDAIRRQWGLSYPDE